MRKIVAVSIVLSIALMLSGCISSSSGNSDSQNSNTGSDHSFTPSTTTKTLWDETRTVQMHHVMYYNYLLERGDTLDFDIATDGAPITYMVLDSENFNIFNTGFAGGERKSWKSYVSETNLVQKKFSFTAPASDRYYFVIETNGYVKDTEPSSRDINVRSTITLTR